MKRCPKCSADYFDNMLEFCIEDGARLTFATQTAAATAPLKHRTSASESTAGPIERLSQETVVVPNIKGLSVADQQAEPGRTARLIEVVPIFFALAHNWWQWLYLEKTYISSITDFLISANFLMWLLLLVAGTVSGVYTVKYSRNKTIGIISLVALAVNLILFLVPRR